MDGDGQNFFHMSTCSTMNAMMTDGSTFTKIRSNSPYGLSFEIIHSYRSLLHIQCIFRVEEITGVWMGCDTNENPFDRCLFHQAHDDDGDFDQQGVFAKKGVARIYSVPQHQWGPRCLSIRLQSSSVFTLSVYGSYLETDNSTHSNLFEPDVTYYQETLSSNGQETLNLLVKVFTRFFGFSMIIFQNLLKLTLAMKITSKKLSLPLFLLK